MKIEEVPVNWMDRPSATEMERGRASEIEIEISSIHFCDTWSVHPFHIDKNSSKKSLVEKYGHSHFKSAFGINFRLREVVKLKFMQVRVFTYFQFDYFPKSKFFSESRFKMRMSIFQF